jgi:protein CpxP
MSLKNKGFWALAFLLAVPFVASGASGAPFQGGGYGGGNGAGPRREPMTPDEQLKHMTKNFNLTADQQAKIKPILVDARKKMDDARSDSSGDRQAMRQKMMQIRQDSNEQIRTQLDDKQKEKFDKEQQEREEKMQNRRGGPGGPAGAGGNAPPQN